MLKVNDVKNNWNSMNISIMNVCISNIFGYSIEIFKFSNTFKHIVEYLNIRDDLFVLVLLRAYIKWVTALKSVCNQSMQVKIQEDVSNQLCEIKCITKYTCFQRHQ